MTDAAALARTDLEWALTAIECEAYDAAASAAEGAAQRLRTLLAEQVQERVDRGLRERPD